MSAFAQNNMKTFIKFFSNKRNINLKIQKKFKYIFVIATYSIILLFTLNCNSYAAYPQLITKLNVAFEKIKTWLISLSTPAAAVAIATGIFIKKFSFGDDERIRLGKKLIRTTLVSYVFILLLDLILSTIHNLLSA
jgi:hypothetical protein